MLGHDFYFRTIRKYVTLFGTLFNDIHIERTNAEGETTHYMKVPLSYGPKEKTLARVDTDPEISRQAAIQLPRMSFEMVSMDYDAARKFPSTIKNVRRNSSNTALLKSQYTPVPYDFKFELGVFVKNAEDGTKIIEQIIPFFRPDFTPTVELISEMDEVRDIPIILDKVDFVDTYTDTYEKRRAIQWTLHFTMKGFLYGPVRNTTVIKFANTTFYNANTVEIRDAVGNTAPLERLIIRPGLDANGSPTSNISITVPLADIDVEDDWGYITIIENL